MTISAVDFASLLCSRLCHDLLSPVGALNNGLELLADEHDPEMRARCLELLSESAKASANKLKFFRLAFGAAGGFGETVDSREARAAIEGLFGDNHKVNLGWLVEDATLPKAAPRTCSFTTARPDGASSTATLARQTCRSCGCSTTGERPGRS